MTTLLDQIPAAISRVQRELVLARFIGKLAVDQGVKEIRNRVEAAIGQTSEPTAPVEADISEVQSESAAENLSMPTDANVDVETLALADYDQLPASHIVSKLDGLEPDERAAIERYERAGRHRRTILGKLEQLEAAP